MFLLGSWISSFVTLSECNSNHYETDNPSYKRN
jgi:hypothetical protein